MKLALLAAASLLAFACAVPAASAWPPVCIEKEAGALRTHVHVQVTCGPQATVSHCPPFDPGHCWLVTTEPLLP